MFADSSDRRCVNYHRKIRLIAEILFDHRFFENRGSVLVDHPEGFHFLSRLQRCKILLTRVFIYIRIPAFPFNSTSLTVIFQQSYLP